MGETETLQPHSEEMHHSEQHPTRQEEVDLHTEEMNAYAYEQREQNGDESLPVHIGGSGDTQATTLGANRRSQRARKPPVRPYDKYLENPRAK